MEGDRPDPSVIMAKALMAGGIAEDEESSSVFVSSITFSFTWSRIGGKGRKNILSPQSSFESFSLE